MRITTPASGSRVPLGEINLASIDLYTSGDAHLAWQTLRADRPVFWQSQPADAGFWAVTRKADVVRVLGEYETFTSERGTAIAMLGAPDPSAGLMMQATDPPRHHRYRRQLSKPFSVSAVHEYAKWIRSFVREAIKPAIDGETLDVADSFTRMPMAVGAMMMGLPEEDIDHLLGLAYASLAPNDPKYSIGSETATSVYAHCEIIKYFAERIEERRRHPSTDLISHLLNIAIDGHPLTETELLLNCLSLLLGAVVTTSQAISATLLALAEQHGGEGVLPESAPLHAVVDEALRWSSPVTHFMRHARHDVEINGTTIRAGSAVTAWIASANRDESVFDRPYTLDVTRSPNQHIAFGFGPHRCLGANVARLMLQESFDELISRFESFELAGPPRHLASNEIAGLVHMPLRLKPRSPGSDNSGH